jgi:DNA modification methylase
MAHFQKRGKDLHKDGTQTMSGALNGVCPYFTMFPLSFPQGILKRYAVSGETVLDPFAGRGTTLYAARCRGMKAYGVDSNPVAIAISEAKLANATPKNIVVDAASILSELKAPASLPSGEFWEWAFSASVLNVLCRFRESFTEDCRSDARKALRAIILGALHGPLGKKIHSYFSNQCPRTYAPKPRYALNFWKARNLFPPKVDVIRLIQRRAERFYSEERTIAHGQAILGDSQQRCAFDVVNTEVSWVITSPPYYGLRTYTPDQWLRNWFLGGPAGVDYSSVGQLPHSSRDEFCAGLRKVWQNCAAVSKPGCRMVIRFGSINDRQIDALAMIKNSLADTLWRIVTCRNAGSALHGRRQADHFVRARMPITEYDIWTVKR